MFIDLLCCRVCELTQFGESALIESPLFKPCAKRFGRVFEGRVDNGSGYFEEGVMFGLIYDDEPSNNQSIVVVIL